LIEEYKQNAIKTGLAGLALETKDEAAALKALKNQVNRQAREYFDSTKWTVKVAEQKVSLNFTFLI